MIGALIILLITVFVGLLLYVYDRRYRDKGSSGSFHHGGAAGESEKAKDNEPEICCGQHLVCDKPLTPRPGEQIVYYDDEELDRFAGRDADAYTPDEIGEIREVMETLLPTDVAGWARSIQLRGIALPSPLRDELFLLLTDGDGEAGGR